MNTLISSELVQSESDRFLYLSLLFLMVWSEPHPVTTSQTSLVPLCTNKGLLVFEKVIAVLNEKKKKFQLAHLI